MDPKYGRERVLLNGLVRGPLILTMLTSISLRLMLAQVNINFMHASKSMTFLLVNTCTDSIHQWAPSLKEAFKVTLPLSSKWQSIGTLLEPELPEGTLDKIRADYFNQSDACHREMLKCWLRQANPHPTWKALAEAIEPFDASKADLIRKKYHCT